MAGNSHLFTAWPQPPDPRPGHFGARGFEPPVAMVPKFRLQCNNPVQPMFYHLKKGVVLGPLNFGVTSILWKTETTNPSAQTYEITLQGYNPNIAAFLGRSVEWRLDLWFFGQHFYAEVVQDLWPVGRTWPLLFLPSPVFPWTVPWPSQITVAGVPYSTPTTVIL